MEISIPYDHTFNDMVSINLEGAGKLPAVWKLGANKDLPGRVFLRCGGCHLPIQLKEHTIDIQGKVFPSILHACNSYVQERMGVKQEHWHVFARLENWFEIVGKTKSHGQDVIV